MRISSLLLLPLLASGFVAPGPLLVARRGLALPAATLDAPLALQPIHKFGKGVNGDCRDKKYLVSGVGEERTPAQVQHRPAPARQR